ncbi:hypothetical protein [Roseisolibacter sp. H3M3-2]|uniref:hypothetical protein n=1 Tax=Roseisolibacter sp. H3M3-2 TaxID=3031323 RepID=UPI0023DBF1FD|nr:hypothetical protein [Roseisolibacter sp. H3M3-2]MDF1505337.1 hypothetical protein [Roseisolibacter sp. H3M3-2]
MQPPTVVEYTLTQELALAHLTLEVRVRGAGRAASGEARVTVPAGRQDHYDRLFRCRAWETAPARATCVVSFADGAPDWLGLFADLESLDVARAPAHPPRSGVQPDGMRWTTECLDGTPWSIARRDAGGAVVRDEWACGRSSPERLAYEGRVDSILGRIWQAARAAPR